MKLFKVPVRCQTRLILYENTDDLKRRVFVKKAVRKDFTETQSEKKELPIKANHYNAMDHHESIRFQSFRKKTRISKSLLEHSKR